MRRVAAALAVVIFCSLFTAPVDAAAPQHKGYTRCEDRQEHRKLASQAIMDHYMWIKGVPYPVTREPVTLFFWLNFTRCYHTNRPHHYTYRIKFAGVGFKSHDVLSFRCKNFKQLAFWFRFENGDQSGRTYTKKIPVYCHDGAWNGVAYAGKGYATPLPNKTFDGTKRNPATYFGVMKAKTKYYPDYKWFMGGGF